MGRTLRTAAFKKKVALEALKEDKTISEIASDYGIHPMQVSQWKRELIEEAEKREMGSRSFGEKNR